jgi:hypothetical protein
VDLVCSKPFRGFQGFTRKKKILSVHVKPTVFLSNVTRNFWNILWLSQALFSLKLKQAWLIWYYFNSRCEPDVNFSKKKFISRFQVTQKIRQLLSSTCLWLLIRSLVCLRDVCDPNQSNIDNQGKH